MCSYFHNFFQASFLLINHSFDYHGYTEYPGQCHKQWHSTTNIAYKPKQRDKQTNKNKKLYFGHAGKTKNTTLKLQTTKATVCLYHKFLSEQDFS